MAEEEVEKEEKKKTGGRGERRKGGKKERRKRKGKESLEYVVRERVGSLGWPLREKKSQRRGERERGGRERGDEKVISTPHLAFNSFLPISTETQRKKVPRREKRRKGRKKEEKKRGMGTPQWYSPSSFSGHPLAVD